MQQQQLWTNIALIVEVLFLMKAAFLGIYYWRYLLAVASRTIYGMWTALRGVRGFKENPVLLDRMERLRLKLSHAYMYAVLCAMLPAIVSAQRNLATGNAQIASGALRWEMLFFLSVAILHFLFPKALQVSSADSLYLLLMASCIVVVSPLLEASYSSTTTVLVSFVCRIPSVILTRKLWQVVAANLVFLVVDMHRAPPSALALEIPVFLLVLATAVGMEVFLRHSVEEELRHNEESTGRRVATALLHLTCDAVIELDEMFRLTGHSKELATILLRERTDLAGIRFSDFVASSGEASHALQMLREVEVVPGEIHGADEVRAAAFHTRLVDSCSSKFRTEVFHIKYRKADGEIYHLLGLRDFTDQNSLAREPNARRPDSATVPAGGEPDIPDLPDNDAAALSHELESSRSLPFGPPSSNELRPVSQESLLPNDTTLFTNEDGVVQSVSPAALSLLGKNLAELFPNEGSVLLQELCAKKLPTRQCQRMQVQWNLGHKELVEVVLEMLVTDSGSFLLLLRFCGSGPPRAQHPESSVCLQVLPGVPGSTAAVDLT
mmetsp:Transcript_67462/g.158257  ORF Transcript_67462/g.158257 Transcript_67462/m.158257 type:complete len:551 (+) Transcript_67462:62-1714(+)